MDINSSYSWFQDQVLDLGSSRIFHGLESGLRAPKTDTGSLIVRLALVNSKLKTCNIDYTLALCKITSAKSRECFQLIVPKIYLFLIQLSRYYTIVLLIWDYYSNPLKDYITEKRTGRFKRTSKVRKLMDHISLDQKGRKFPPRMMQTRDLNPISTKLRKKFNQIAYSILNNVASVIFRLLYL